MSEDTKPSYPTEKPPAEKTPMSRRDFLRGSGAIAVAAAVGAAGTAGFASVTPAGAAESAGVDIVYRCPIDGKLFSDYDSLKKHFKDSHPSAVVPEIMTLNINGHDYKVQVEPHWTLRQTLAWAVGLTGNAKEMCDRGECGSCTVLIDDVPALSCSTLVVECDGKKIETAEGIAADPKWEPLVQAYIKWDTSQCGYCTPGQMTVAKYILMNNPKPSEDDIRQALAGNICRCGTYTRHVKAIQEAAEAIKGGK